MDHIGSTPARERSPELAERLRTIRQQLPGQMLCERLELAALHYGPLYPLAEIRARIGETLPRRFGFVRGATFESIETYRGPIPDEALLRYDDAAQSGLFGKFLVAAPAYFSDRQADPWIIAEVAGTDRWAVITQWQD
jgi:hypothetical protein